MNLLKSLILDTNSTYTANNAYAYKSTLNYNLDFFFSISSFKSNTQLGLIKFQLAYFEDKLLALKNLFYLRNIRGTGQGIRDCARIIYKWLAINQKEIMLLNLANVAKFGRQDDYYAFVDTPLEEEAFKLLKKQIDIDLVSEHPSLTAKWLKSVNSSKNTRKLGLLTAKYFNLSERNYRKLLSTLRAKINVVETKMTSNQFDKIEYETVPSKAMLNYHKAFKRHDEKRFSSYIEDVKSGLVKINSKSLYPYEILRKYNLDFDMHCDKLTCDAYNECLEQQWNNLPNYNIDSQTIVVADTSGSMMGLPLEVCISLAIYFARNNKSIWKNKLITFSSKPSFVSLDGCMTLHDSIARIPAIIDNTDIEKVFDLILDSALKNKVKEEDMVKNILIISDMHFDEANCFKNDKTYTKIIKDKFKSYGYKTPNLIYWNVNTKLKLVVHSTFNESGVRLISGFSPSIIEQVLNDDYKNPLDVMLNILNEEIFSSIKI